MYGIEVPKKHIYTSGIRIFTHTSMKLSAGQPLSTKWFLKFLAQEIFFQKLVP